MTEIFGQRNKDRQPQSNQMSTSVIRVTSLSPAPLAGSFPFSDELSKLGRWRQWLLELPESPQRDALLQQVNELITEILKMYKNTLEGESGDDVIFGRPRSNFAYLVEIDPMPLKRRLSQIDTKKRWRNLVRKSSEFKKEAMEKIYELLGLNDNDMIVEHYDILNDVMLREILRDCLRAPPISPAWTAPSTPKMKRAPDGHHLRA